MNKQGETICEHYKNPITCVECNRIEKLQQENARLKELAKNLDNYTTHTTQDCSVPLHKCDCGLDRLREELNP